jgi:transcriptional antiterminator NusG
MNAKWYIIKVMVSHEDSVLREIMSKAQSCEVSDIETVLVPKFPNDSAIKKESVAYPGYVFIKMVITDSVRQIISSVDKASFLGGEDPLPVSEEEMNNIFSKLGEFSGEPSLGFVIGDKVEICYGPFQSFNGTVEDVCKDRSTLRVSVFVFGQYVPVELSFTQVKKV